MQHSTSITETDGTGMLSFNPSNLGQVQNNYNRKPDKPDHNNDIPGMSFGGKMLENIEEEARGSLIQ